MIFNLEDPRPAHAKIMVIGVGGAGCNAVNRMMELNLPDIEFIAANTDLQALYLSKAPTLLQMGHEKTRGLGAGGDPVVGRDAAIEDKERIRNYLKEADMVFITAGMGGGTGTGAAPVIAQIAKECGALTIAIVTKPFAFEGKRRNDNAASGLRELESIVDTFICIPNQKLLQTLDPGIPIQEAFQMVNDVLSNAVQGISELIISPGMVNLDFADIRNVMSGMGKAVMGMAIASGSSRAEDAVKKAVSCQLLDNVSIDGARNILINITSGKDLMLSEVDRIVSLVHEAADREVHVFFGTVINPAMNGDLKVTVIATGFEPAVPAQTPRIVPAQTYGETSSDSSFNRIHSSSRSGSSHPSAATMTKPDENIEESYDLQPQTEISPENNVITYESATVHPAAKNSNVIVDSSTENAQPETPFIKTSKNQTDRHLIQLQPELELQDEQEDDLIDHLPSYAKRNLTNGSFRRRSELESDEIQVDSSQYMIPAFLRRKAD